MIGVEFPLNSYLVGGFNPPEKILLSRASGLSRVEMGSFKKCVKPQETTNQLQIIWTIKSHKKSHSNPNHLQYLQSNPIQNPTQIPFKSPYITSTNPSPLRTSRSTVFHPPAAESNKTSTRWSSRRFTWREKTPFGTSVFYETCVWFIIGNWDIFGTSLFHGIWKGSEWDYSWIYMGIENEIELDLMVLHRQKWGKMEIYRPKRAIYSNVYIYWIILI